MPMVSETNLSNGSRPCVSYVAQQKITSLTYTLGDFVRDAVTRGYVQSSWYMTAIPMRQASRGEARRTGRPSISIRPASGR